MSQRIFQQSRRSIRLKGYDYSQEGLYFITICCQDRASLFGKIIRGDMILNDAGRMVSTEWLALKKRFPNIELHEYMIMPNHFHGILEIVAAPPTIGENHKQANVGENDNIPNGQPQGIVKTGNTVRASLAGDQNHKSPNVGDKDNNPNGQPQGIAPTRKTVGDIIGAFKSITSVKYIRGIKTNNWKRFNGKLWQRNYWEHIIRDEQSFYRISEYIINNPRKWTEDKLKL